MALVHCTIFLWIMSHHALTGLIYQHTIFQRFTSVPIEPLNGTSSITFKTTATENACLNTCHNQRMCQSVVFDENSSRCHLYNAEIIGGEASDNQDYLVVQKKTVHEDVIAYAQKLCHENSSGYIYNATVPLCYKIDTQGRSKTEAESFCDEFGGRLLRINTERKQRLVEDLHLQAGGKTVLSLWTIHKYRVDGVLSGGVWAFSDGTAITNLYWYPGEPAGGGISIGLRVWHDGKWEDISHTVRHGCICEKDISLN